MIIRCPECSTGFRLPDDRVTEDPIKVRCSKCSHVFQVGLDDEEVPTLFDTEGNRLSEENQNAEPESDDASGEQPAAADISGEDAEKREAREREDAYSTQMGTPAPSGNAAEGTSRQSSEDEATSRDARGTQKGSPNAPPGDRDAPTETAGDVEASSRGHQETLHGVPGTTDAAEGGDGDDKDRDGTQVEQQNPVDQTQQGTPASGHEPGDDDASSEAPGDASSSSVEPRNDSKQDETDTNGSRSSAEDYDPFPHAGSDVSPLNLDSDESDETETSDADDASSGAQASAREILEGEDADDFEETAGAQDAGSPRADEPGGGASSAESVPEGGVSVQTEPADEQPEYDVGETVITDPEASEDEVEETKLENREVQVPSSDEGASKDSSGAQAPKRPDNSILPSTERSSEGTESPESTSQDDNGAAGAPETTGTDASQSPPSPPDAAPAGVAAGSPTDAPGKPTQGSPTGGRDGPSPSEAGPNAGSAGGPRPTGDEGPSAGAGGPSGEAGPPTSESPAAPGGPPQGAASSDEQDRARSPQPSSSPAPGPESGTQNRAPTPGTGGGPAGPPSDTSAPETGSGPDSNAERPGSGVGSRPSTPNEPVGADDQLADVGSGTAPSGDWVLDEVDQADAAQFGSSGLQTFSNYLLVAVLLVAGFLGIVALQNDLLIDFKKFDQMLSVAFQGGEYEPRDEWTEVKKVPVARTDDGEPVEFENVFAQIVTLENVESPEGGPRRVLVLKGDAKNITRKDYLGVTVRGKIFDKTGKNIQETEVPLGAELPNAEISTVGSTEELSELLPKEASRLGGEQTEPFTVIFDSLPPAVAQGENVSYSVELAEKPVPAQAEK